MALKTVGSYPEEVRKNSGEIMKFVSVLHRALAAVVLLSIVACGSAPKASNEVAVVTQEPQERDVASLAEEELEANYKAMLQAEFPGKEIAGEVRRLASIFYRAEGLLRTYDTKLDEWAKNPEAMNATDMNTDETYSQLLAARILYENSLSKISFYARKNLETMFAPSGSVTDKDRATAVRLSRDMKKAIRRLGRKTDKLALQTLARELFEVQVAFYEEHKEAKAGRNAVEKPLADAPEDSELSTPEKIERFYSKNRKTLDSAVEEASKDTGLSAEIEALAPGLRVDLISNFSDREPQSNSVVAPGSGSSGNMTGHNFKTGRWALTYDDGPSGVYTPVVAANLKKRGLKATFFQLAKGVASAPSISRDLRDEGHALGNHSYTHAQLTKLGSSGLKKEIDDSTAVETKYFGFKPKIFRCPYGACGGNGSTIRKKIAAQGMVHVFWNVDSLDWQDKNPKSVYARIKKQMSVQKRGIILVHDIHSQTVEATRMLMDDFVKGKADGSLRLITIPQAIDELNNGGMK
jgi:peptidoglycan/xylan/chitin deacetylase (PgdA/CDA1 family)